MKKLLKIITGVTLSLAMAIGVGIGVANNNKKAEQLEADSNGTLTITRSCFPSGALAYGTTDNWTATASPSSDGTVSGQADLYATANQTTMQTKNSSVSTHYHNTTAMPGYITGITVDVASGTDRTYTVYASSSAAISSTSGLQSIGTVNGNSALSVTNASTNNYRYFYMQCGGGASYLNSIVISYTISSGNIPTPYTVSFDANGGSGNMNNVSVAAGDYTLPANGFTAPNGKEFSGWKAENAGELIAVGGNYNVTDDVKFYAQWSNIQYTVTYANGGATSGTVPTDNNHYDSGAQVTVLGNTDGLTKYGYVFSGWTDGVSNYKAGDTFSILSNKTLTAVWSEEIDNDAITYELSDMFGTGSWSSSYTNHSHTFAVSGSESAVVTINSSSKQGSTITDVPVAKGEDVTFVLNSETRYIKNITFHARQWTTKEQTMTLHTSTNKGSSYTNSEITSDDFRIRGKSFTSGTNAIKITFSSSSNQVGYADFVVTYDNLPDVEATAMTFSPTSLSLFGGEQGSFTPSLSGGQGNYEKTIVWTSSNPSIIATPSNSEAGVAVNITPEEVQTETEVTITGTVDVQNGASASIVVTVKVVYEVVVTSVSVSGIVNNSTYNGSNDNTIAINKTIQLSSTVNYQTGNTYMNGNNSVAWSSSSNSIATVNATGLVTFKGNGTVTITATSSEDNTKSGSLTFTISNINSQLGSEDNPYTVAQAKTAIDALGQNETIANAYVTGKISQIDEYNSKYNSITYWISDDGTTANQLEAYSGKGLNGANFTSIEDIETLAEVVITGTLKLYNTTYEFDKNNQIVSYSAAPRFTVTFNSLGGDNISPIQNVKIGTCVSQLPTPTKANDAVNQKRFEFAGWYTVADPEHPTFEEVNKLTESTPINSNLTVYAKYNEINYFVVTFNTNGGNSIESQNVDSGDTVAMPNNPIKPADQSYIYTFAGWYTNVGLTDAFDDSEPISSNLTIYAKYTTEAISSPASFLSSATTIATLHGREDTGATTISKTITELATANSWTISSGNDVTCYTSFDLDSKINISTTGSANCGSVWGTTTKDWRLYQNKSGNVVVTAANGYTLSSVTFTYSVGNTGTLKLGNNNVASESEVSLSGSTATFTVGNTASATNGQVKITAITVKYARSTLLVDNVAIRFGATIAKDKWDSIKTNWTISDYGVMLMKASDKTSGGYTSIEDAYNKHASDTVLKTINKCAGGADYADPYLDGNNYLFTVKVSFPNDSQYYDDVIYAAPYVVVNGQYYFLTETHKSVEELAADYYDTGYEYLSDAALTVLAGY